MRLLQSLVEKTVQIGKNNDKCRALGSDEKVFVQFFRTERSDTSNIIVNKKPVLLIKLKSFAERST